MLIPLGTDRPRRRPTVVTYWLLGIAVLAHVGRVLLAQRAPEAHARLMDALALRPGDIDLWTLITYQFVHADLMHIVGNMLFLFVFGPPVEDRLGRWWFLLFYLAGGAAAGLAHAAFDASPVIGASGSIAAVTGAFLVFFPLTRIRLLLFFLLIGVFQIPAWWFIAFAIAKDIWFSSMSGGSIAYAAHLGGYAFGAGISAALLGLKILPRETYDLFSIGRQAHRRRRFRELVHSGQGPAWSSQPGTSIRRDRRKPPAESARDRKLAEGRARVVRLLDRGEHGEAADAYVALLDDFPEATLPRDQQLAIANQLFGAGHHQNAAVAWELFLKRFPSDREADQVRLMLALTHGRYLNDPVGARRRLTELNRSRLSAEYAAVADTLDAELG